MTTPQPWETLAPGRPGRLFTRCWATLAAGLVVGASLISPAQCQLGRCGLREYPPRVCPQHPLGAGYELWSLSKSASRVRGFTLRGYDATAGCSSQTAPGWRGIWSLRGPWPGRGGGSDAFPDRNLAYVVTPRGYAPQHSPRTGYKLRSGGAICKWGPSLPCRAATASGGLNCPMATGLITSFCSHPTRTTFGLPLLSPRLIPM